MKLTKTAGLVGSVWLGSLVLATAQADTQPGATTRPQRAGNAQRPVVPGVNVADNNISEAQRQLIREAFEAEGTASYQLFGKLARAHKELQDLSFAEKTSPEAIAAKAAELGKLEGEMALFRAKVVERVRPKLTEAQLELLKKSPLMGGIGAMPQAVQRPGGDYRRPSQGQGDENAPRRPARPAPEEPKP